ncbi:hypothetical protein KI387_032120, partial [Taxus chinensis]
DQKNPSLTKEKIKEAIEREAMKIIEALVEQELECNTDIVMEEDKEESVGKDHGGVGGPSLL